MRLTIKKIIRQQKISKKTNNPYISIGLLTEEYGDNQWINGFGNKDNENWKQGDIINVEIKEGEYNGNKTLNFIIPNVQETSKNEIMDALRKIFSELQEIKKLINK